MQSTLKRICVLILLWPGALQVLAAEKSSDEIKAIQPSLGFRAALDSNIYNTSTDEIDSWIGIITPAILLSTAPSQQSYALLYKGEYGKNFEDSVDNYADHALSGFGVFKFGSRGHLDITATTEKGHRDRGSDQTDGLGPTSPSFPAAPDEFDRKTWSGKFRYGADGNRGRLLFGIGGSQLDYTNNLERTRFYDFDTLSGSAGISLLLFQRTAIVFNAAFTDVSYENARPDQAGVDGQDWRYLLGLTWTATSKTSGSIRFGVQQRRFDDPTRSSTSNPSWEVDVRWSPREYSYVDFVTSRVNQETFGEGAFIDSRAYKVSWTHEWSRGWKSIVSLSQSDLEFVDSERDQNLRELYLGLRYAQSRLLTWEAGYALRSRNSSISRYVYDGNMFTIGLNLGT